jgi:hypothetical protein
MSMLIEQEAIVCGEILKAMPKAGPWSLRRNALDLKGKGGLGIINLINQNIALLLKFLDKFYNKRDVPWVNLIWNSYYTHGEIPHASKDKRLFWWRDVLKLCDDYRAIAKCKMGNGTTVLFWLDIWNNCILQQKIPRLFSFARNKSISVANFFRNNNIEDQFHIPLYIQAFEEYQQL